MTKEAVWLERVRAWRASGKTSDRFAEDQGLSASGLRYWSSRLGRSGQVPPETRRKPRKALAREASPSSASAVESPSPVRLARVMIERANACEQPKAMTRPNVERGSGAIVVEIGGARVMVDRAFDAELLRAVVHALAEDAR